ncbi:MAG: hypothetical protein ABSG68_09070 [Thermoguttaceae bacterium]|jgi:Leucine-rich repeat (LRR) protein
MHGRKKRRGTREAGRNACRRLSCFATAVTALLLAGASVVEAPPPRDDPEAVAALKAARFIVRRHDRWGNVTVLVDFAPASLLPSPNDAWIGQLQKLPVLRELIVRRPMTSADFDVLKGLRGLDALTYHTVSQPLTDADMKNFVGFKSLRKLNLHGNQKITDSGIKHLAALANLEALSLDNTGITDAGLHEVGKLTRLEALDLGQTRVTSAGLKHLAGLSELRVLDLNSTTVGDDGLGNLKGLKELRKLTVHGSDVSLEGAESFCRDHPRAEIWFYNGKVGGYRGDTMSSARDIQKRAREKRVESILWPDR